MRRGQNTYKNVMRDLKLYTNADLSFKCREIYWVISIACISMIKIEIAIKLVTKTRGL